jgi:hypothetical protein
LGRKYVNTINFERNADCSVVTNKIYFAGQENSVPVLQVWDPYNTMAALLTTSNILEEFSE